MPSSEPTASIETPVHSARVRAGLVDWSVLIAAEEVRYRNDFSSCHWLYQVIAIYQEGISNDRRRDAFERVLRAASRVGVAAARKLAEEFPAAARIPRFEELGGDDDRWTEVKSQIIEYFPAHIRNRFGHFYKHDGD